MVLLDSYSQSNSHTYYWHHNTQESQSEQTGLPKCLKMEDLGVSWTHS